MSELTTATALWWAVVASGIYHGVNPGMGWPLAVSAALMERRQGSLYRALAALAAGETPSPELVAEAGGAFIEGLQAAGVLACGKHFPGHGSVVADSHTHDVCDPRPLADITRHDLQPFASLSNALDAVMMAHVLYPEADAAPAGYSGFWIRDVLRGELGFSGTVFSDDLGMFAAKAAGGLNGRVRASLQAGCDAVLVCDPADVSELMTSGRLPDNDASEALGRLRGRAVASREDVERVGEWRHWKKTIEQLEQWA